MDNPTYEQLQTVRNMTHQVWDAAVLMSLRDGPKRYTDIGAWLGTWGHVRPTDSAITAAIATLVKAGLIERAEDPGNRRSPYALTSAGRRQLAILEQFVKLATEDD